MKNNWHEIWNNRNARLDEIDMNDEVQVITELKRIAGWDSHGSGSAIAFHEFKKEYEYIRDNLNLGKGGGRVFELGCGSGANLYFLLKDGFKIGGSDYSESMIAVTKKVIGEENLIECFCGDAAELPTDIRYDAVFVLGVFQYFESLKYAEKVLDRMIAKAEKCIAVAHILAEETKAEYLDYCRKSIENYKERYKDLPKFFMSKEFLINYANRNNLDVNFDRYRMKGYWNDDFMFDCFMYKRN